MNEEARIKISYNVTQVTFNLYKVEDGAVSVLQENETILHKRDDKFLTNYLKKKYKDFLTVELVDYEHKTLKSLIPFSIALEYGSEV